MGQPSARLSENHTCLAVTSKISHFGSSISIGSGNAFSHSLTILIKPLRVHRILFISPNMLLGESSYIRPMVNFRYVSYWI